LPHLQTTKNRTLQDLQYLRLEDRPSLPVDWRVHWKEKLSTLFGISYILANTHGVSATSIISILTQDL
jgi:hypothetical protein